MAAAEESSFEEELEWCIRQLELGLLRSKDPEQKKETEQYIRKLKSGKTPFPRKRQLMKHIFGDYRSKMKDEPLTTLPSKGQASAKIERIDQDKINKTATFLKKKSEGTCTGPKEVTNFKFNFDISS